MNVPRVLLPTEDRAARLGSTVAAALATTLATFGLWQIFDGRSWLLHALLVIALAAVTGALARRAGVPAVLTMAVQLLALMLLVTATQTPQDAFLGLVPTPTSLRELVDLLEAGASVANAQSVPVAEHPGLVLLVMLGVGVAAIEVDFIAVTCRCPAIAGVVLMCMYGVPAVVLPEGAPWLAFLLAAAGWLLLLYDGQRRATREWGTPLTEPALPRPSDPRQALGRRIALGALLGTVLVAGLVPGVGEGQLDGFGDSDRASSSNASDAVRLDLNLTLERSLRSTTAVPLLSYFNIDLEPQYLRMTVLDTFDGVKWAPAATSAEDSSIYSTLNAPTAGTRATTITPYGRSRGLRYLPAPYDTVRVDASGEWQWNADSATIYSTTEELGSNAYRVRSTRNQPDARQLSSRNPSASPEGPNTALPAELPDTVATTARTVVEGADSDYARLVQLQAWFRSNFRYDVDVPPADDASEITAFLTNRVGYCQHFAATFALMARSLGIPSRVVVGFAPGRKVVDDSFTVTTRDFHAWPEVRFDDLGWVRFEPTPRSGGDSTLEVPAWSVPGPFAPPPAPDNGTTAERPPSAAAPERPNRQPVGDAVPDVSEATGLEVGRLVTIALVVLAVLALAAVPGVVRVVRRRRRFAAPAGAPAVEAAWAELADTARDLGISWPEHDTPRRTVDAFVTDAGLEGAGARAAHGLRHDLEQVRYAPAARTSPVGDDTTVADDTTGSSAATVRQIRREVLGSRDRWSRWRAAALPRTILDSLDSRTGGRPRG